MCQPTEIRRLEGKGAVSHSLIKTYQRVWEESPVYREVFSLEEAQEALEGLNPLIIATRRRTGEPIGFTGGWELNDENTDFNNDENAGFHHKAYNHREAYKTLRAVLSGGPMFYIDELGVLKEDEGAGLGGWLLEELLGHARADGYHAFILMTNPHNDKAISLYRRKGFSFLYGPTGLIRRPVKQKRQSGENKEDLRSYLYRVDDFTKIELRGGSEACLEFIRPKSMMREARHEADREAIRHSLIPIAEQISRLFGRAFWHSDDLARRWPIEDIMGRLPKVPLAILAFEASSREPIAYAMFDLASWKDHEILFVDSLAVSGGISEQSKDWQGTGLGGEMLIEGLRRMPADIVAARTQNPAFFVMLQKTLKAKRILPIDADYSGDDVELLKAVKNQVVELRDAKIDLATGICKQVYKEGKLGDYEVKEDKEEAARFEGKMRALDRSWDRNQGDAVIVIATQITMPS